MKCVVVRPPDLWSGLDQAEPGGTYPRPVVGVYQASLVVRIPDLWSGFDQAEPGGTYP